MSAEEFAMHSHRRAAWSLLLRLFMRESGGSLLPMFALTMVPMMGMVGAAVDYSRASGVHAGLQSALDSATLAAARDGTANWPTVALAVFNANLPERGATVAAPTFTKNPDGSFSGSVTANVPASFMKLMGTSSIPTLAQSKAELGGSAARQLCVLALSSNAQPAVKLTGNASIDINAPQCIFQVNSNSTGAVNLNGNTSITSASNCFVGSAIKAANATLSPAPELMCKPVPDPFAYFEKPTAGPCDHVNFSASGQATLTLQPGVYCGGMQFSGSVKVTFAPGLFVIKDGLLQASGGSSYTGNGVTFFLTGIGAGVQLSGQADWHLVAPVTGALAGFVFFLDPQGPTGPAASSSQLSGSAEMYFEGLIYLPKQRVALSGSSETYAPSPYTTFIADTFDISGNGSMVINNDVSKTNVPVPIPLQVASGGQPRLLQ
jgi:Flp pilus assembly protein TadG